MLYLPLLLGLEHSLDAVGWRVDFLLNYVNPEYLDILTDRSPAVGADSRMQAALEE